jgi:hypothetical protein
MKASMFRLFSLGRAVENKARNTRFLNVLPVEDKLAIDGEVTHSPEEQTLQGFDALGNRYDVKAVSSNDLVCEWLPSEDNRATPPDIRRNELVEIWQLGDSDQYYWRSLGLRNDLRTLESVVWTFGASPDPGGSGMDFEKCYFLQFSAHDKHITIGTSKANGEPYTYRFQINTKDGAVYLTDDIGNYFELVSKARRLQMKNSDGSFLKIERKAIDLNAAQYIKLTSGGSTLELNPNSFLVNTTKTDINSSASFEVTTGSTTYTTGNFAIV